MTKTQFYTATSVDGFIADPDNSLEWLFEADPGDDVATAQFGAFVAGVGAMCMGATTYEWVLAHDDLLAQPHKWTDVYGDIPCWVFTHRDLPRVPGVKLTFVSGDVAAVHDAMFAAADGRNIWIVGGGDLAGQFADQGRLDEVILGVAPVFLGAGAPLLPRRITSSGLTLVSVAQQGQFALLTYAVRH